MASKNNRERILVASVELFNLHGVVPITTNHIAAATKISPGNLYFHFRNKEGVVRELFLRMCEQFYAVWRKPSQQDRVAEPLELLRKTMRLFWEFRFFHREMYHMRRKDPELSRLWKSHLIKTYRLLRVYYGYWSEHGVMRAIQDPGEIRLLSDVVLVVANAFLNFYESPNHPASPQAIEKGIEMVSRLLLPYLDGEALKKLEAYLVKRR